MDSGASSTITALLSTSNPDFPPHNYLKNVIVRHYLLLDITYR